MYYFVIGSYPPFTAACNTLRANIGGAIELYSTRHTPLASGLDGFSPAPRRREHLVMEQRYTEGEEREGERTGAAALAPSHGGLRGGRDCGLGNPLKGIALVEPAVRPHELLDPMGPA